MYTFKEAAVVNLQHSKNIRITTDMEVQAFQNSMQT